MRRPGLSRLSDIRAAVAVIKAEEYLQQAKVCLALAESIPDPAARLTLERVAGVYKRLAERAERRDKPDAS